MPRAVVIFECEDAPYSMVFYAPEGMELGSALVRADSAVREYNDAFDWDSGEDHQPRDALTEAGFEMADYAVMQEKW